jgi:hypothetical protein
MFKVILIALYTIVQAFILWVPERILWLIGLFAVAVALPFGRYSTDKYTAGGTPLFELPAWANWCWGNDRDGVGDTNWIINDCGYGMISDYHESAWFKKWVWLAWRNPCHNLTRYKLYSADTSKLHAIYWFGDECVDNRIIPGSDNLSMAGWQVVWGVGGSWLDFRSGVYVVIRLFKTERCIRIRIGYKLTPHTDFNSGVLGWTNSFFSPFKKMIVGW